MNVYEIAFFVGGSVIVCLILILIFMCLFDHLKKIEELEDKIKRLYMINDMKDGKLERLEDDIYALMDRIKELESDHNTTDSISIKELQKIIVNDNERGGVIELHW